MNLSISHLSHTYNPSSSEAHLALKDIQLEVQPSEFVALIGPSGCGKSTLLRIIAGLVEPTKGSARLAHLKPEQASAAKQISWMAQKPALLPWRSVLSNVALAQKINPKNSRTLLSPLELLDLVRLGEVASAHTFTLSGGMQQRVALARTLALGADYWLMDEPFTALDELTRESLTREVLGLWKRFRPTVLWVTHNISEAVRMADRVLVMSRSPGQIHAEHRIHLARPRDETTPAFQDIVRLIRSDLALKS